MTDSARILPDALAIRPADRVSGAIRPPGSKSITNRALIVAALADGRSILSGALESDDTRVMIESWRRLGVAIEQDRERATVEVAGCGGRIPAERAELFLENSGTSMRFLTAAVALGYGEYRLDGVERMRERPIAELLDALRGLGAAAESESGSGCPPLRVRGRGLSGGQVPIGGSQSSQFLSGLLMAAPYAAGDVALQLEGELVSEPFVAMTIRVMADFGVRVERPRPGQYLVRRGQRYAGRSYDIEPDATAASYFWAAAAVTGGSVTVQGIGASSIQGDAAFVDVLERMGAEVDRARDSIRVTGRTLRGVDVDMNAISDTVPTLAVLAACADGPTTIRRVAHIRAQETDRIRAVAQELRKVGADVTELADGLRIVPGVRRGARIETYRDHRMAMSFAILGLCTPGIVIVDPACTAKTYPGFFADLDRLTAMPPGCQASAGA